MRAANYDKFPMIEVPGGGEVWRGWNAISARLREALAAAAIRTSAPVVVIECYSGVFEEEIRSALRPALGDALWITTRDAMRSPADIERLVAADLGGDDPLFGRLTRLTLEDFLAADKVDALRAAIARASGPVVIIGVGASLVAPAPTIHVYADLARWEAQRRQRHGEISNVGVNNRGQKASLQYKRAFFIDWRLCDRLKQGTLQSWDYLLDTCVPGDPKLVTGDALRRALSHCATRPFRLVPCFDPGPWGGQWMKEVCDLDREAPNFAWCFDCVPEENSLRLNFGAVCVEVPATDLVFAQPRALLGEAVERRFGPEFPIRFDFLDTMGGGNLSLQVHPLSGYIQEHFGVGYTQDESYYLLDARPGAVAYLGRRNGASPGELIADLEAAQDGGKSFEDERFIARFPARRHDHFLIPAGTLHCSGRDCMVLEISATPYIFTFKLWDWGRLGLDGLPRPINIARAKANICWERDEDYARRRLINRIEPVAEGPGWREERTGLHESGFIETRRHWFTDPVAHDTGGASSGSVNVLNLVQGEEVRVESPTGAFEPFTVHYAETFIVPAAVGRYDIRPCGRAEGSQCATIKALVRR